MSGLDRQTVTDVFKDNVACVVDVQQFKKASWAPSVVAWSINYQSLKLDDEENTHTGFILNPILLAGQKFKACGPSKKKILFPKGWIQKYFLAAR